MQGGPVDNSNNYKTSDSPLASLQQSMNFENLGIPKIIEDKNSMFDAIEPHPVCVVSDNSDDNNSD